MQTIRNNYIYQIIDINGAFYFEPLGEKDAIIDFNLNEDEEANFYEKSLSNKLILVGDAYKRILELENSSKRCEQLTLNIYKNCRGENKLIFTSLLSLNDFSYNLDKCYIEIDYQEDSPNKCLEEIFSEEIDLFDFVKKRVITQTSCFSTNFEYVTYNKESRTYECWGSTSCKKPNNSNSEYYEPANPDLSLYSIIFEERYIDKQLGHYPNTGWNTDYGKYMETHNYQKIIYAREISNIVCDAPIPEGWQLINNCTNGLKKIARKPQLINCKTENGKDGLVEYYKYDCGLLGDSSNRLIDNGMLFSDVINNIFNTCLNGKKVISNFFQINPTMPSALNYVTNEINEVNNLIFYQKSDVKRPNDFNNATKALITREEILKALYYMFNVKYDFDKEGNLLLEHVLYWEKDKQSINIDNEGLKKYFAGKKGYKYDNVDVPNKEIFKFYEETNSGDWKLDIEYTKCIPISKKIKEKKYTVDKIITDVELCLKNPDANSDIVEDSGLVLIATTFNGSNYCMITKSGIYEDAKLNNSLSWAYLLRNYLTYNRYLLNAKVNNYDYTFKSAIWLKEGLTFSIPFCFCSNDLNPEILVNTQLGVGRIKKASYNLSTEMLELDLVYNQNAPKTLIYDIYKNEVLNNSKEKAKLSEYIYSNKKALVRINIDETFTYYPINNFIGSDEFKINNNLIKINIKNE